MRILKHLWRDENGNITFLRILGTALVLAAVLLPSIPVYAADPGLTVHFERIRESPVDVTFRVTISNASPSPERGIAMTSLLANLSMPTSSIKSVKVERVKIETSTINIPIYEDIPLTQEEKEQWVNDYIQSLRDAGEPVPELLTYEEKVDYLTSIGITTSETQSIVVGYRQEVKQKEVSENFRNWSYSGNVPDTRSTITLPGYNADRDGWGGGVLVLDFTINTGLQVSERGGWGSKGLLVLDIGGNLYWDDTNSSWWDVNWDYRRVLSFNATSVVANVTTFPVFVELDNTKYDMTLFKSGGADIRFVDADDAISLDYEIESWADNTSASIRVKIPQINAPTTYADYFYMYFGNAAAADAQDVNGTWDGRTMAAVYHFADGAGTNLKDSSISANNGTVTMGGGSWGDGILNFGGATTYVNINGVEAMMDGWGTGTVVMWTNANFASRIVQFGDTDANTFLAIDGNYLTMKIASTTQWRKPIVLPGTYYQLVVIGDGVAPYYYLNGSYPVQAFDVSTDTTIWLDDVVGIDNGRIGSLNQNGAGEVIAFNGYASELRFYQDVLTPSEITVDYLNMTDSLLYYGDTNPEPTVTTQAATGITMDKDGVTGGNFNGSLDSLGGAPSANVTFEYGLLGTLTDETAVQGVVATGNYTASVPAGLTPGETYQYRIKAVNTVGTATGANVTFAFTMPSITTDAATAVSMTAAGVTSGNFNGNVTNLGVATDTYAFAEYGLTVAYGSNTTTTTRNAIGAFSIAMPGGLTPGATYHYRMNIQNGAVVVNGADESFTFTMPTVTTGAITGLGIIGGTSATLNGEVTNMGAASSAYRYFEYGSSAAYGTSTISETVLAPSVYSASITDFPWDITLHARSVVRVGAVYSYGADQTITVPSRLSVYTGTEPFLYIMPLVITVGFLYSGVLMILMGLRNTRRDGVITLESLLTAGIGIIFLGIGFIMFQVALDAITNLLTGLW